MDKGYRLTHVIVIIFLTAVISAVTTGLIIVSSFSSSSGASYSDFVQDENLKEFLDVYSQITEDYYEDVDKKKIIENAINGMMANLNESYTTYLDENSTKNLMQELNGKYTGIGITVSKNIVQSVFDNSPAFRSGIIKGDKIVRVNGVDVDTSEDSIPLLIKKNSDNVVLDILIDGVSLTFTMQVEEVDRPSVEFKMLDNSNIGFIAIRVFSSNLDEEVKKALDELKAGGMKKLIVDLRDNTGGYLDQANKVASLFLKKDQVIYYLEDKSGTQTIKDDTSQYLDIPVVVLVNGSTASASEILTAALKESYGATIVGKTTYGKGKVQHTMNMENGSMVKYTSSRWLTPSKKCIDELGILPDYNVDNEYVYDETDPANPYITEIIDNQFTKAVELLNS